MQNMKVRKITELYGEIIFSPLLSVAVFNPLNNIKYV